jgi:hypothetical protein
MIKLFDVQNNQVIPTEHCYTLYYLKNLMEYYPDQYMKIYAYLFYMTCPNPELNPCFDVREDEREEYVLKWVDADFSPEDDHIQYALEMCRKMYETPTSRAYYGIKQALDKMANVMATETPTFGRDGSATALLAIAKNFDAVRQSFKGVYKDLMEEQQSLVRGGQRLGYDQ